MQLRPSSFNVLKWCLGALLSEAPTTPMRNEAAEIGSQAHKVLEDLLCNQDVSTCDPDMVMYGKSAVDYIMSESKGNVLTVEQKRHFVRVHPDCYGTPDLTWFDDESKTYHVFDYKYGFVPVDAKDNLQLITYASSCPDDTEFVKLHIYQPRAYRSSGAVDSIVYPIKDFNYLVDWLRDRILKALDHTIAVTRSGSHCRYCKAFTVCNNIDTAISSGLELLGEIETDDTNLGMQLLLAREIQTLASKRLERLENLIEAKIENNEIVENVNIKHKPGRLVWNTTEPEVKIMCELLGITPTKEVLLTPKQLQDSGVDTNIIKNLTKRNSSKKLEVLTSKEISKWLNS